MYFRLLYSTLQYPGAPAYDKKKTALLLGTIVELCACVCANMQGHGLSNQPQITLVMYLYIPFTIFCD